MTTLVLTSSFPHKKRGAAGGGGFVFELCTRLSRDSNIIILTPFVEGVEKYEEWDGIRIHRFSFLPFSRHRIFREGLSQTLREKKGVAILLPFFFLSFLFNIVKIVRIYRVDVIHAHWIVPQGIIAALYKKVFSWKGKLVITVHGSDLNNFSGKFSTALKKFVLKNSNEVTVVSEPLKQIAESIYPDKKYPVIPMGIDIEHFSNYASADGTSGNSILFIGRLSREKGLEFLLRAMPDVIKTIPDAKLTVIGDGILREELEMLSSELSIDKNVEFLGYIENKDIPVFLSKSACLIMPSLSEGSPVVLAEAMCNGNLILSSDIPVFQHLIEQGKNGYYCNIKDTPSFSQKITEMLSLSNENRRIICNQASDFARDHFSWDRISMRFMDVLK